MKWRKFLAGCVIPFLITVIIIKLQAIIEKQQHKIIIVIAMIICLLIYCMCIQIGKAHATTVLSNVLIPASLWSVNECFKVSLEMKMWRDALWQGTIFMIIMAYMCYIWWKEYKKLIGAE